MLTESEHIEKFASLISAQQLGLVVHVPEQWAYPTRCFGNVYLKIQQDGGRIQFGWMFHVRSVLNIPELRYLIAVHHAVWHAPNGMVIDVTPFHSESKHHPIMLEDGVLFLLDDNAVLVKEKPLPSRFYACCDDERLINHIKKMTDDEEFHYNL